VFAMSRNRSDCSETRTFKISLEIPSGPGAMSFLSLLQVAFSHPLCVLAETLRGFRVKPVSPGRMGRAPE